MNNVDTPGVSPEMEVLLWSIRVDGEGDDRLPELLKAVDQEELYRLAQRHQLTAFLYHRLQTHPYSSSFNGITLSFKKAYVTNMYRNLLYTRQLVWIIELLRQRSIEVIPFKGIVLAYQAYGTSDLRHCGDIDVLVKKRDLRKIISLFQAAGMNPSHELTLKNGLYLNIKRGMEFTAPNRIDIDLHWGMFDKFTRFSSAEEYFRKFEHMKIDGFDVPTLSPEDTLILVAVHGTKHLWGNLRWINDVIHLLHSNPDLDIGSAFSSAESLHCRRMLVLALYLAEKLGGVRYSDDINQTITKENSFLNPVTDIMLQIIAGRKASAFEQLYIFTKSRDRWRDAFWFAIKFEFKQARKIIYQLKGYSPEL